MTLQESRVEGKVRWGNMMVYQNCISYNRCL